MPGVRRSLARAMRLPPVRALLLGVGLLLIAGLADRALVGEASAARPAALLRFDTDARAMAASVAHALARVEQEITAGHELEGVASERLSLPPPRIGLPRRVPSSTTLASRAGP